jgi:hypothetical protein
MNRTDEELIAALEGSYGFSWREYFVVGEGVIAREDREGRLSAHIIEDDALSAEVCEFLKRKGKVREIPPKDGSASAI